MSPRTSPIAASGATNVKNVIRFVRQCKSSLHLTVRTVSHVVPVIHVKTSKPREWGGGINTHTYIKQAMTINAHCRSFSIYCKVKIGYNLISNSQVNTTWWNVAFMSQFWYWELLSKCGWSYGVQLGVRRSCLYCSPSVICIVCIVFRLFLSALCVALEGLILPVWHCFIFITSQGKKDHGCVQMSIAAKNINLHCVYWFHSHFP